MSKKKRHIKYPKERAVLADVLPYEIPLTFSNRYFYRFLVANEISISNDEKKITYKNPVDSDDKEAIQIILKILFGVDKLDNISDWNFRKIPFVFKIAHKENRFRELAIVHPINQLKLIDFYNTYKELILYHCTISNYSIRKPAGIGKYTFVKEDSETQKQDERKYGFTGDISEYENLKTFFAIEKYKNIYRFYEDYRYQRAEKKYNYLYRFDIANCFDSIYTHSIAWAVLGLDAIKENVQESKKTFAGKFDVFIQYANYGETNGIVIGPEFSRIFAEIILQRIDKNVETKLQDRGYVLKKHYELYRYVDDYFLFCDSLAFRDEVISLFSHELKQYKLSINDSKSKEYKKPIITEITIAKERIIKLFEDNPRFTIEKKDDKLAVSSDDSETTLLNDYKTNFYFDPTKLITQYKIIIKETGVEYKDVLNYTLAILHNKIEKNLKQATKFLKEISLTSNSRDQHEIAIKKLKIENEITSHIVKVIDLLFFLYSVSPRVNSTIKVSHILSKIILFYKKQYKNEDKKWKDIHTKDNREKVFKKILDETSLVLNKNMLNEFTQVESLYLLIVLKELGRDFRLTEFLLCKYLNVLNEKGEINSDFNFNYFTIVVVLYYIGNSTKFPDLKDKLLKWILKFIEDVPVEKRRKTSELTYLLLDLFSCPFINIAYKEKVLEAYRKGCPNFDLSQNNRDIQKIVNFTKNNQMYWSTKWTKFNLEKELNSKKSLDVYS
ncbi:MAG: Reverse transcriptase (RNA-dependent DNA polymerase) [Bacteroidetes bacterium ADurb.Bin174]|nr:MAG: Reverse transcriptase (RNA-dependent DNA polymerase) [Bacteroidetes bacterium ADurb.Bin174]